MATLECSVRVWLFHLKHLQGERGKLSPNVIREVCEYLADPQLVHVTKTFLSYFQFRTCTWGPQIPLRMHIQADGGSRWVALKGRVFCCGGLGKEIATAYMLACDGSVERKADMSEGRRWHGLLALHSTILVFGGANFHANKTNTCEKFQLLTNTWTSLPPMKTGRFCFNPCMFQGVIYLCGWGARTMEAFSPHTDTFLPLNITLPGPSACCLYVDNNLLVVNSNNFILKYALGPDGYLAQQSATNSPEVSKEQNSQPVVDKTQGLYFIITGGKCLQLNMHTGARVACFSL